MDIQSLVAPLVSEYALCSDEKNSKYSYLKKQEALTKKFLRFGNEFFLPSLSIDIDSSVNLKEIKTVCLDNSIPYPNMVVYTTKGVHLHWIIDYPVKTKNKKRLFVFQSIVSALVPLFGGDKHAKTYTAGRVWRNPILHKTKLLSETPVTLFDFQHLIKKLPKSVTKGGNIKRIVSSGPVAAARVGERHGVLFNYIRKFAYKNAELSDLENLIEREALRVNGTMEEPLPIKEVLSIVRSVVRFMQTRYNGRATKDVAEYNRELAKRRADKTKNKIKSVLVSNPTLSVTAISKLSKRKAAKLFGISASSALKYLKKIKDIFAELVAVFILRPAKPMAVMVDLNESLVYDKFKDELKFGFTWGVP